MSIACAAFRAVTDTASWADFQDCRRGSRRVGNEKALCRRFVYRYAWLVRFLAPELSTRRETNTTWSRFPEPESGPGPAGSDWRFTRHAKARPYDSGGGRGAHGAASHGAIRRVAIRANQHRPVTGTGGGDQVRSGPAAASERHYSQLHQSQLEQ